MEEFPKVNTGQVVLMRVESSTGHVLDEDFNVAIMDSQKVYTIFDREAEALAFANNLLFEKKGFNEFLIYGSNEKLLHYLVPSK